MTLLITSAEILTDYRTHTNAIAQSHQEVYRIHGPTIVENLWVMNDMGVRLTVQSIAQLPEVEHVALEWDGGDTIYAGEEPLQIDHSSSLNLTKFHREKHRKVGKISLASSYQRVREKLIARYLITLIANLFKSILVAIVALTLFHRMASQHIQKIANHIDSLDFRRQPPIITLDRKLNPAQQQDELQLLTDTFNKMSERQYTLHLELNRRKSDLQVEVKEKSEALELAQKRLLEKDRLATIGSTVALVAHELRNPLGTIKSSVFLLQKTIPGAKENEVFHRIDRSIKRCDRTIENLRSFGAHRADQKTYFDLNSLVRELVENERYEWGGLHIELQDTSQARVYADRHKISQVICNLLANAAQALGENVADNKNQAIISIYRKDLLSVLQVDDYGPGIDEQDSERLFDPLYTTKTEGFGMGLSLSRYFVEEQSGQLTIGNSKTTSGATAKIELPYQEPKTKVQSPQH